MLVSVFISSVVAEKDSVNQSLESLGYGPSNLNVPYRGNTPLEPDQAIDEATRFGCHWWIEKSELKAIRDAIKTISPTARIVAQVNEQEAIEIDCERSKLQGYELADAQAGERFFVQIDPLLIEDFNRGLNMLAAEARGKYANQIDHPTDTAALPLLRFRTGDEVVIKTDGRDNRLKQVYATLVTEAKMTTAQRRPLLDVVNVKEQTVSVLDLLPPDSVWPRLTARQMRDLGY